jgi:hypothetical protein
VIVAVAVAGDDALRVDVGRVEVGNSIFSSKARHLPHELYLGLGAMTERMLATR